MSLILDTGEYMCMGFVYVGIYIYKRNFIKVKSNKIGNLNWLIVLSNLMKLIFILRRKYFNFKVLKFF